MGAQTLSTRAKLGAATRYHPDDLPRITDARRDLAAAKIADYVERVVAEAPPLTEHQRARIARLLAGGAQ